MKTSSRGVSATGAKPLTLLNVSDDPTREVYSQTNGDHAKSVAWSRRG